MSRVAKGTAFATGLVPVDKSGYTQEFDPLRNFGWILLEPSRLVASTDRTGRETRHKTTVQSVVTSPGKTDSSGGLTVISVLALFSVVVAGLPDDGFRDRIRPILIESCLNCHSGDKPKGKLDLSDQAAALKGGKNGPGVVPGKPDMSLIVEKIESGEMPPEHPLDKEQAKAFRTWVESGGHYEGPRLVAVPKRAGADWWSLRPITPPPVPSVEPISWVRNPIDAFILQRLIGEGLRPAPDADKISLIRRVTFDLTGLPPTPDEVESFLKDASPKAYETVVDRLLASPRYGERWGRHWLDVVRFGESHGYEMNTLRPNAWPYRDYVIRAFNDDTPLPRFALEQFAGDSLNDGDTLTRSATGFLVGGVHDMVGNATIDGMKQQRADDLDDMITAAGSAFLGLTINCARCHDHKFDPISQADYYRVQAIFAGVQHTDRAIPVADSPGRKAAAAKIKTELDQIEAHLDRTGPLANPGLDRAVRPAVNAKRNIERFPNITARALRFTVLATSSLEPCIDELEIYSAGEIPTNIALASNGAKPSASSAYPNADIHKIVHLNDGLVGNSHSWISDATGKGWAKIDFAQPATIDRVIWGRDREEKFGDRLPTHYYIEVETQPGIWQVVASSSDRAPVGQRVADAAETPGRKSLLVRRDALITKLAEYASTTEVYAGTFSRPEPTHRLERGDPMRPAERVAPGGPKAIKPVLELAVDASESDRRLSFAKWLGDPANPLPARVMVNRAWHYHFGRGLISTPSDFGFQGGIPSHPALLDWLADTYRAQGYRLKPIHKLIVTSSTYRQSGLSTPEALDRDRNNLLLSHRPPRRLEAESIRDAMLFVSGSLNLSMGGPGYNVWEKNTNYVVVFTPRTTLGPDTFRRMVYQFKPRSQNDPTFGVFDCPDGALVAPRRNASTTALQALNLLNSEFVVDQSARLAARIKKDVGELPDHQIDRAFHLTFARPPSPRELAAAQGLVNAEGLPTLTRALFNANEFVYVP